MADIKQLSLQITLTERELRQQEGVVNRLVEKINNEIASYTNSKKNNQEVAKRINATEQSLKTEQAKYDAIFVKLFNLTDELENTKKQYTRRQNYQMTL